MPNTPLIVDHACSIYLLPNTQQPLSDGAQLAAEHLAHLGDKHHASQAAENLTALMSELHALIICNEQDGTAFLIKPHHLKRLLINTDLFIINSLDDVPDDFWYAEASPPVFKLFKHKRAVKWRTERSLSEVSRRSFRRNFTDVSEMLKEVKDFAIPRNSDVQSEDSIDNAYRASLEAQEQFQRKLKAIDVAVLSETFPEYDWMMLIQLQFLATELHRAGISIRQNNRMDYYHASDKIHAISKIADIWFKMSLICWQTSESKLDLVAENLYNGLPVISDLASVSAGELQRQADLCASRVRSMERQYQSTWHQSDSTESEPCSESVPRYCKLVALMHKRMNELAHWQLGTAAPLAGTDFRTADPEIYDNATEPPSQDRSEAKPEQKVLAATQ